jgi:hypothetical protein
METMRRSTVQAFDTVAWGAPEAPRFEVRSTEPDAPMPSLMDELRALPRVVYVIGGAVVAAAMGALLGGAMAL